MNEYQLFAPKFQNWSDSSGHHEETFLPRTTIGEDGREPTKRGQRVPFPARTAPFIPSGQRPMQRNDVTHSMADRQLSRPPSSLYPQSDKQQLDNFNRTIDSMHLPEDMQRPIATRDMMKSMTDADPASTPATRIDNLLSDRQLSMENREGLLTISGAGTFEDMFY